MVPDTVFFDRGHAAYLVYNKKDRQYNYIRREEESHKLTRNELKDFFEGRKRRKELDINIYYPELLKAKKKKEMEE